uniref:DNA cytosine methyltransferase n=1 Tax=Eubacterium sp. TaxID=142586 RepID=UPI004028FC9B
MIKLLLGGSPCTFWSIAQTKNRETEPSGLGWELFENYLIAKEKFKPDFFLYENNVSASKPIKEEIKKRFKVGDGENHYIEINSALVSAQNRKRFYVHNCGEVEQPEDRGILLSDILETGTDLTQNEKAYCLTETYNNAVPRNTIERKQRTMVADPICLNSKSGRKVNGVYKEDLQPSVQDRIYSIEGKSTAVTAAFMPNIAKPIRVGDTGSTAQAHRVYSCDGKSVTINAGGGGQGVKTGLYACPANDTKQTPIYEVKDGKIGIKGKEYPIKLVDGYYIIRKLTVTECCRLQTLPDDYCRAVSKTQAYKGLGNGWTAEVIIHILNGALKDVSRDEKICVLSMYDGIGTGRYCLDKMGFKNVEYHAFEIDKYAIKIAQSNYPDIIEHGDAYQVRDGLNFIYGVQTLYRYPIRNEFHPIGDTL